MESAREALQGIELPDFVFQNIQLIVEERATLSNKKKKEKIAVALNSFFFIQQGFSLSQIFEIAQKYLEFNQRKPMVLKNPFTPEELKAKERVEQ